MKLKSFVILLIIIVVAILNFSWNVSENYDRLASCRNPTPKVVQKINRDSKFKYIYVVGVEGNGHHMMISVLSHLKPFFSRKDTSQIKIRVKLNDVWAMSTFPWQKKQHLADYRVMMKEYQNHVDTNGTYTHYYEDTSFPYLNPRNGLRRWDLVEMVNETQQFADLKILVIYRDPIAATYSAISRNFTTSVVEQSRIVEDNLLYIQNHLLRLDRDFYRTLQYEDFVDNPQKYAIPLANYLEIPLEDIQHGLKKVRKNPDKWRTALKEDEVEYLENFFDESRRSLWPIFYEPVYSVLNYNKPS